MSVNEPRLLSSDSEDSDDEVGSPEASRWKADLLRSLKAVKTFGNFSFIGQHELFTNPGLEIADSLIPLPLVTRDAEILKALSQQAPFGRGDETVVDTTVRKTWELNTEQFQCSNPSWKAYLDTLLQEAAKNLGMPGTIRAEPYKLLLYEEGSFFKRHKDSEKVPGMVGTLVICLPSKHEGGDVHLSHAGKARVFATSKSSAFDLTALAWYSDVTHEIKEITSGYRLVLTYNIIQEAGAKTSASYFVQQQNHLQSWITRWRDAFPKTTKLVYRLEHKYSKNGLSLRQLKGSDAGRVQSLYDLCARNGFYLFLARLTKTENEGEDADDFVEDECLQLEYLLSCDGVEVGFYCSVKIGDILGRDPYADRDPDSESEGPYTGNESQPSEYRYHDSAAVLVPREHLRQFAGSCGYGKDSVNLLMMVSKDLSAHLDDDSVRSYATDFMHTMLEKKKTGAPVLKSILTNARELRDGLLYRKAIQKAAEAPQGWNTAGNYIGTLTSLHSLGPLISDLSSLREVAEALGMIEGLLVSNDELLQSYLQWRPSIEMYRFNNKESLQVDDLDLVMYLITKNVDDSEWINTRLTARLNQCADRSLLYKLLDSLFQKSEGGSLAGADVIAGRILEATLPKLKLNIDDFTSSASNETPYSTSSSSWEYAMSVVANFTKFLDVFLKYNFKDLAKQLLELSCENVAEAFRKGPEKNTTNNAASSHWSLGYGASLERNAKKIEDMPSSFANKVLESLIDVAEKHEIPPLTSLKDLFEVIFRKYIIVGAPTYPPKPVGWAHKPRRCTPYRDCAHCTELNRFLCASDEAQVRFQKPANFRTHVERQLPKEYFRCESGPSPNRGCYTLVVTKLGTEYQDDVNQFQQKVARLYESVWIFARDYVQKLLGDELYRELVLLEKIRQPPPPPAQETGYGSSAPIATMAPAAMPAPFGNPTPALSGVPAIPTNAQPPNPVAPGIGTGYFLQRPAPPQNMPPTGGPYGMMGQTTQPSYDPVSLPPINQNGPAPAQHSVLPRLQPTTGNGGLKRRADDTWEYPEPTKARTSEYVDLTDD
ncbi:hypothetical protein SLS62_010020 [Diatrype stigma]|uniref:Prolyl 4-hydroxylase alpha subunit Fe(2+) 2OG dioxygenase domain-containing protein n=1 Tax=Diatrype stigma TaxID=117547 RepID=A0AAN9UBL0_9PEZI